MDLQPYLEDLENRIDPAVEESLLRDWRAFCDLRWNQPVFAPRRPAPSPPRIPWPAIPINRALEDFDAMALSQLAACSDFLERGSGKLLMVRSNYGTPIMPMLFGVELFVMAEETNTLPGALPLPGGPEGIRTMLERGEPSLDQPYMQRVFEMGRRFHELFKPYPKLRQWVFVYHPDMQGPMDILEMLWGSEMFCAFYDDPDLVHRALDLVTRTYIRVMRAWEKISPLSPDGYGRHWGNLHPGVIMLRDDSAMNLSPGMFDEFIRPYDQRLLQELGGGAIHACGRVDHWATRLPEVQGLRAFHMSQPHLNQMETVWSHTIDRGMVILDMNPRAAQEARASGRDLRGRVHTPAAT